MPRQLTLRVGLSDHACFDNFLDAGNEETVEAVRSFALTGRGAMLVFGEPGSGKTHLLYAAQKSALGCGRRAGYLSMSETGTGGDTAGFVDNWSLICVDDLQCAAGRPDRERFLFNLIEQQRQQEGGAVLAAGSGSAQGLGFALQDLTSRLAGGAAYRARTLNDDQKKRAMRLRARFRGFDLPDEVADYILRRFTRDTAGLFSLLDRIDETTLSTQRRVTIPLIKHMMGSADKG